MIRRGRLPTTSDAATGPASEGRLAPPAPPTLLPPPALPSALRLVELGDERTGLSYQLVFSQAQSNYEDWIAHLGGPDENIRLMLDLLGGRGTLVDVGANIGTVSLPVAVAGSRVLAIEVNPANCIRLVFGARVNGVDGGLRIIQAAAGDRDGVTAFAGEEAAGHITADGSGHPAPELRLDTILHSLQAEDPSWFSEPFVLKIDVEGYEVAVLGGATETLRLLRPVIVFEAIDVADDPAQVATRTKEIVADAGYDLFLIRHDVLCPRGPEDAQEGYVSDFLAVPAERRSLLDSLPNEVRPLHPEERLDWVAEMAAFHMQEHKLHAARVLLRWANEEPELCRRAEPIVRALLAAPEVAEMHDDLSRIPRLVKGRR